MIVTIEEAMNKECRAYQPLTVKQDNDYPYFLNNFCIANSCMHWNWIDKEEKTGYCGLSGRD